MSQNLDSAAKWHKQLSKDLTRGGEAWYFHCIYLVSKTQKDFRAKANDCFFHRKLRTMLEEIFDEYSSINKSRKEGLRQIYEENPFCREETDFESRLFLSCLPCVSWENFGHCAKIENRISCWRNLQPTYRCWEGVWISSDAWLRYHYHALIHPMQIPGTSRCDSHKATKLVRWMGETTSKHFKHGMVLVVFVWAEFTSV